MFGTGNISSKTQAKDTTSLKSYSCKKCLPYFLDIVSNS
jgi:hypothetical protein